jgi:hypothetical protein
MDRVTALVGLFGPDPELGKEEHIQALLSSGGVVPKDGDVVDEGVADKACEFQNDPDTNAAAEAHEGRRAILVALAKALKPPEPEKKTDSSGKGEHGASEADGGGKQTEGGGDATRPKSVPGNRSDEPAKSPPSTRTKSSLGTTEERESQKKLERQNGELIDTDIAIPPAPPKAEKPPEPKSAEPPLPVEETRRVRPGPRVHVMSPDEVEAMRGNSGGGHGHGPGHGGDHPPVPPSNLSGIVWNLVGAVGVLVLICAGFLGFLDWLY